MSNRFCWVQAVVRGGTALRREILRVQLSAFFSPSVVLASCFFSSSTCLEISRNSSLAISPAARNFFARLSALPSALPILTETSLSLSFLAMLTSTWVGLHGIPLGRKLCTNFRGATAWLFVVGLVFFAFFFLGFRFLFGGR